MGTPMRISFVGANLEENLALGILAAIAESKGHSPEIVPFNRESEIPAVIAKIVKRNPDMVGLSIQFQHRAAEFLMVAQGLRNAGYRGHITCGGQFPSLAFREVLEKGHGVDSVVLYDGEETFTELLDVLSQGGDLHQIAGMALLSHDGKAMRTQGRRLIEDLDSIPFAKRYRGHTSHMGIPFIPIMGSRGCWGSCNYCSIVAVYNDAREHGGGQMLRMRSPENVAAEMALLWHQAKGTGIFCFHDDNFLLPRQSLSLNRISRIRKALNEYGVGDIAIVGKCRPDTVSKELAQELADFGVIRLYVGVENGSEAGGEHLIRGTQQKAVREALAACRSAGIFVCYNLLIFEPQAKLADIRENIEFIREHADHPVNFCRAEPYYGTALHKEISAGQNIGGSYLGFNYRIEDPRSELLFRICSAAFRERNFAPNGVANRYMGLGYAAKVLEYFYPGEGMRQWTQRARELTRRISLDTASFLERALSLAEESSLSDWNWIEQKTARLGLEIAAADRRLHTLLDQAYADMERFVAERQLPQKEPQKTPKFKLMARGLAFGAAVVLAASCDDESTVVDPAPPDGGGGMVVDPLPADGGGGMVVDPLPADGGGGMVVDPPPPDAGAGGQGGMGAVATERDEILASAGDRKRLPLIDQWDDSSPDDCVRTKDMPLFQPPMVNLQASPLNDQSMISVALEGDSALMSAHWEADGGVIGQGLSVQWAPAGPDDRLRVAVRTRGGVAIRSLRAGDILMNMPS